MLSFHMINALKEMFGSEIKVVKEHTTQRGHVFVFQYLDQLYIMGVDIPNEIIVKSIEKEEPSKPVNRLFNNN